MAHLPFNPSAKRRGHRSYWCTLPFEPSATRSKVIGHGAPLPFDPYLLSRAAKKVISLRCTYRSTFLLGSTRPPFLREAALSAWAPAGSRGPYRKRKKGVSKNLPPPPSSFSFNECMHLMSPKKEEEEREDDEAFHVRSFCRTRLHVQICTYSFWADGKRAS